MARRLPHAAVLMVIAFLFGSALFADTAKLKRRSNLRADHDISSEILRLLPTTTKLTVLSAQVQGGYLHVRTGQGEEGWVYARNVTVSPTRAGRKREAPRGPSGQGQGPQERPVRGVARPVSGRRL